VWSMSQVRRSLLLLLRKVFPSFLFFDSLFRSLLCGKRSRLPSLWLVVECAVLALTSSLPSA